MARIIRLTDGWFLRIHYRANRPKPKNPKRHQTLLAASMNESMPSASSTYPSIGDWTSKLLAFILMIPVLSFAAISVNVSDQITASSSGFSFDRSLQTFDTLITVTSKSNLLQPPLSLVIDSISSSAVFLANATSQTADGKPLVAVPYVGPNFPYGSTATVALKFSNPGRMKFAFTYHVAAIANDIGKDVAFGGPLAPPIADIMSTYPQDPVTGLPILMQLPEGSVELDFSQQDPLTAVGACTNWITSCYQPGARAIDDCARSAPQCATSTPWLESTPCCPTACFDNYRQSRLRGIDPLPAFFQVYYKDGSCFPQFGGVK